MTTTPAATRSFDDLAAVVGRLLGPGGCPWDREQTHASLRRYLLEESYELIEAIDAGDAAAMTEELGDLLVHVLFHAEMAKDAGEFELGDVVLSAAEKMIGRHPHVFVEGFEARDSQQVLDNWDSLKREEKGERRLIADAVPKAMPALAYAAEIQNRVNRAGLAWRDEDGEAVIGGAAMARIVAQPEGEAREAAAGEALFGLVAELREIGVDPETALRRHALGFRDRVERTEIAAGDVEFADLSAEEQNRLWEAAGE